MRNKNELYKKEQLKLSNQIIDILELDENNQIILYHLDNDKQKINKIMELIPELRKYFAIKNILGIENPLNSKRPWLSIIRNITKLTHKMISNDKQLTVDEKIIRTKIYSFTRI